MSPTGLDAWMVQIHESPVVPENCGPDQIYPKSSVTRSCRNKAHGCPKEGAFTQLIYHEHICTYVPHSTKYDDLAQEKKLTCHGYLARGLSQGKFVSFNNSFLRSLGTTFFFCDKKDRLIIQAYANLPKSNSFRFKLKLWLSKDCKFVLKGCLDGQLRVVKLPQQCMAEDIFKYRIIIRYTEAPIVID